MGYIKKSDREPIAVPSPEDDISDDVKEIKKEVSSDELRYTAIYYEATPARLVIKDNKTGLEMDTSEAIAEILNKLNDE